MAPDETRENLALRDDLRRLRQEFSELEEELRRERRQRELDLDAMRRSYEESLSRRLTRPVRAARGLARSASHRVEADRPAPDVGRDLEPARSVLYQRHRAGVEALEAADEEVPSLPDPDFDGLPEDQRLPEVGPSDATPELLRAAIMRSGCLIVRGAVGQDDVAGLVDGIDRAFSAREAQLQGVSNGDGYFEEFEPDPRFDVRPDRVAVQGGRALLSGDSPLVLAELLDILERAGLRRLARGYLGDRPLLSINKSQLRRAAPQQFEGASDLSTWHQDGAFLGETRALNAWISLSHCGDRAPGIDIVARRLEEIVAAGTSGSTFDWSVSRPVAEEVAGEAGIVRPIFEPGDVLLFDEFLLHATAAEPGMTGTRYAVENWFFAASHFPPRYAPLAL